MKKKAIILLGSTFLLFSAFSCGGSGKTGGTNNVANIRMVNVPQFDADSAYLYVKSQVDFGPRVPNSKEHVACGNYLAKQLETFGAKVTDQYADLIAYDGTLLKARNIIGSYKPENKKRIALFAHWDTRPWADNDPDENNHHTPILGANDGASGVGALLEIARLVNQQQPELGIDIIFLDAEDYGARVWALNIGLVTRMCKDIMLVLAYCLIWLEVKILSFLKNLTLSNMHRILIKRYGKPPKNWGMGKCSLMKMGEL